MTLIRVPYGKTHLSAELADTWQVEIIAPQTIAAAPDPLAQVTNALDQLVGALKWDDLRGAQSAAIAINDKTRPVPHAQLLPPLLAKIAALGIPPAAITFIIATGTHPPMLPDEFPAILPAEIIERYRVISHDAEATANLTYLGTTSRGTPVHINQAYLAADLHFVVGNMEPHQFMGFSGGVKSVAVGLAGKATINHNHAMMTAENARLGEYDTNPARQDVEEIGRMIRVDLALNTLLNGQKQIVGVLAGEPVAVMQAGIPQVREIFQVKVAAPFDLTITSPGGYPKDLNVYQAQKALAHAALVTKSGGTIILVAACNEGTGSHTYEAWVMQDHITSHEVVFAEFAREGYRVGPHKAYQLSRDAAGRRVLLVSDMAAEFVQKLLLEPAASLQAALDSAVAHLPVTARIGVLPAANATIPLLAP
jgi:nickel-dependent lactate racemase